MPYTPNDELRHAPVGVFDSGLGGVTILQELLRELPNERFVYFGDNGNCPYGTRTVDEIQRLADAAARFLLAHGAKLIVVACNTASVSAIATLRATFATPFVAVVPPVKPAAERTHVGRVGVLATEASARGDYLRRLIADFADPHGAQVFAAGSPRLVELVEAGALEGPEAEATVRAEVAPLLARGIDTLALGCTHFPALRPVFERVVGPAVEVIDSGAAVARQTRRVLERERTLARPAFPADGAPQERVAFWTSGAVAQFERVAAAMLGRSVVARYSGECAPLGEGAVAPPRDVVGVGDR